LSLQLSVGNNYNSIAHPLLPQQQMVHNSMGLGANPNFQYNMLGMTNGPSMLGALSGALTDTTSNLPATNVSTSSSSVAEVTVLQQLQNTISNLEARLNAQSDLVSGLSAAASTPSMGSQRLPRDNKLTVISILMNIIRCLP
jgi:hypothetical protein